MTWHAAVLDALRAYCERHQTRNVSRQQFISEALPTIVAAVNSQGRTPHQTLSRILQELRDEGVIDFHSPGQYLLLDSPFDVESEELTDAALDVAIRANKLRIGRVETGEAIRLTRHRRGQDRVRALCREEYGDRCAVCDVAETALLVASHILPWAESAEHRGNLENVICLCRFHDPLFERGYWTLDDELRVLARPGITGRTIRTVIGLASKFRSPRQFHPDRTFLRTHRMKFGYC